MSCYLEARQKLLSLVEGATEAGQNAGQGQTTFDVVFSGVETGKATAVVKLAGAGGRSVCVGALPICTLLLHSSISECEEGPEAPHAGVLCWRLLCMRALGGSGAGGREGDT